MNNNKLYIKYIAIFSLILFFNIYFVASTHAQAYTRVEISTEAFSTAPDAFGNRVVWTDNRDGTYNVYMYDLDTATTTKITNESTNQLNPRISDNRIVWRNSSNNIFMYDLDTSTTTQIVPRSNNQYDAGISSSTVVWEDNSFGDWDVYMYNIDTFAITRLGLVGSGFGNRINDYDPKISGNRIVWYTQFGTGRTYDIFMYDIDTATTTQITFNTIDQTAPIISGDIIAWQDRTSGNFDVYMHDLTTGTTTQITFSSLNEIPTSISDNKIVGNILNTGGNNSDIFMYDVDTGSTTVFFTDNFDTSRPTISGNNIFFTDNFINTTTRGIFMLGMQTPTGLIQTAGNGTSVSLDWDNNTQSNSSGYNIYRATSAGVAATSTNLVNTTQVAASTFTDNTTTAWTSYFYTVTTISNVIDLESPTSTEIQVCSNSTVANGVVSSSCLITCNSGFTLSGNNCNSQSSPPPSPPPSQPSGGGGGGGGGGSYPPATTDEAEPEPKEETKPEQTEETKVTPEEDKAKTNEQSARDRQLEQILTEAIIEFESRYDMPQLMDHNSTVEDKKKEEFHMHKYTEPIIENYLEKDSSSTMSINNFIYYGTQSTRILGAGERAGVVNSYKKAFNKLPRNIPEWRDVIAIANGRWPNEKSEDAENNGKQEFIKVYQRTANMQNPNDNAAVTIIAYGLRPNNRNLESEKVAIDSFKYIYEYYPVSALDWDVVRAIAYSGATREGTGAIETTQICKISSEFSQYLTIGTNSEEVKNLQILLKCLHYLSDNINPTTYFGNATLAAVKQFQADNGIAYTGTVGPSTRALFNKYLFSE